MPSFKNNKLSYTRIIALFFLGVIILGTLLLTLPISSKSREWTPLLDCAFTATSATCVTGLIVYDTFSHWSLFGQTVIISMIQVGGLGVMTIITMFSVFLKKKISLHERKLLMESSGTVRKSGIIRLLKQIVTGTLIFEGTGALLLATRFCPELGFFNGLRYSVFHSVSAFCNAGFDLMGRYGSFSSLTPFADDAVVNLTICILIITGGIGYLVWQDVLNFKSDFKKYSLQSKIVLVTSAVLVLGGWLLMLVCEWNSSMAQLSPGKKILAAFFQSVTARTAGFNTVPLNELSSAGLMAMVVLMFIGGSPGSTAGGVKTTTVAVMIIELIAVARGEKSPTVFKRRLEEDTVKKAGAIITIYMLAITLAVIIIGAVEGFPLGDVVFEVVSAAATVGLTTGITPTLGAVSHLILMLLMYGGRLGGLTLMIAFAERQQTAMLTRPTEKIQIG
ncbi:MAG: Trk family potassium uptake protein [Clostridia bacterium]|nr:Trk family potassium uptake protein [Clostridia bacterium]